MSVSVIIPCRNDQKWLNLTLASLFEGQNPDDLDVIVVDDCSNPAVVVTEYPVRVLRNNLHKGVGYSFDRGVFVAKSDTIVLMGSDVLVERRSWLTACINTAKQYPNAICCAISAHLSPEMLDTRKATKFTYGADLRFFMEWYDAPTSAVELTDQYHLDFLRAASINEFSAHVVPCLIGAFYITTKSWYNHIGGWDTDPSVKLSGHQQWGALEPWISIKTWLAGGEIRVVPISTGHIYHRYLKTADVLGSRGFRADYQWYNKLYIVETMFSDYEHKTFKDLIRSRWKANGTLDRNYELAEKMIRQNRTHIDKVSLRNDRLFGDRDLKLFKDKFGIDTTVWK